MTEQLSQSSLECNLHKRIEPTSTSTDRMSDTIRHVRRSPHQSARHNPFVFMPHSNNTRVTKCQPKVERRRSLEHVIQCIRRSRRRGQSKIPSLPTIHETSDLNLFSQMREQRRHSIGEIENRLPQDQSPELISNTDSETCLVKPVIYDNSDWYPEYSADIQTDSSNDSSSTTTSDNDVTGSD